MRVNVTVTGGEAAIATVELLAARLDRTRAPLLSIVDDLMRFEQQLFERERDWPPVAASTLRVDARLGRDPTLMVNTGALKRSLTQRGAAGQVIRATNMSLTFGTRVWYAKFHHFGTGVPLRPLVGLTAGELVHVVDRLAERLIGGRTGAIVGVA